MSEEDVGRLGSDEPTALAPLRGQAPSGLEQSRSSTGAEIERLKPCPFCGGEARLEYDGELGRFDDAHAECVACKTIGPLIEDVEGAAAAMAEAARRWNARPQSERLEEAVVDCLHHCMLDWTWDDPRAVKARSALAPVGRNAERHDREDGHGPQDEHAVTRDSAAGAQDHA